LELPIEVDTNGLKDRVKVWPVLSTMTSGAPLADPVGPLAGVLLQAAIPMVMAPATTRLFKIGTFIA
jgi:hypothetical protein